MKKSNILLVALIGGISLFFITAFVDMGIKGELHKNIHANWNQKSIDLDNYHYIVVAQAKRLNLVVGDKQGINLKSKEDNPMPEIMYHINGDTLFISKIVSTGSEAEFFVQVNASRNLKAIMCRNSGINLIKINLDELTIEAQKSSVKFPSKEKSRIGKLTLKAEESGIWERSLSVDTLDLSLDASKFTLNDVFKVQGSIKNHSELRVSNVLEFNVERDKSSEIRIWE